MRKYLVTVPFLAMTFSAKALSGAADSLLVRVPAITYSSLDSLIKTNKYTAIYFWPTWCAPCIQKIPSVIAILKDKPSISLLFVNEANSRVRINRKWINFPDVLQGYYRIEFATSEASSLKRLIKVNSMEQVRLFNKHFTHQKTNRENERNPAFFLFDKAGKLLWYNKTLLTTDSIASALSSYH